MANINDWLSIDKVSGEGNASITLTANASSKITERTASLEVKGQGKSVFVSVKQKPIVIEVTLDNTQINAEKVGGVFENGITSTVAWKANVSHSWIKMSVSSGGVGYTPFTITLTECAAERIGNVVFTTNDGEEMVILSVKQIGSDLTDLFWIEFEETGARVTIGPHSQYASISGGKYTDIEYSYDGFSWSKPTQTDKNKNKYFDVGNHYVVYLKNNTFKINAGNVGAEYIRFTKYARVGGRLDNIVSMQPYAATDMFKGNKYLRDASALILPWEQLEKRCFYDMFFECSALEYGPKLPSTHLAGSCYIGMFSYCTSLKEAPELPATDLPYDSGDSMVYGCYQSMFSNCTSLKIPPALPATKLADKCYSNMFFSSGIEETPLLNADVLAESCYSGMFFRCTSLKKANTLPAITLSDSCYLEMFRECTALETPPTILATIGADYCFESMFRGCNSLKYIPQIRLNDIPKNGCYCMFYGCTSLTTIPSFSFNSIGNQGCLSMFQGCTSLESFGEFKVNTFDYRSCYQMLKGCTKLTYFPPISQGTLADGCLSSLFDGCTALETPPALPLTNLAESCYSQMFRGCTNLKVAPVLPSTTLANYCYMSMFYGCTSLEESPDLLAPTLVNDCYSQMFWGCTSLRRIKMIASDVSASYALNNWVYKINSTTGTFIKHPDVSISTGDSGIPRGWTVETATV